MCFVRSSFGCTYDSNFMAIRLYLGPGMRFPTDEHAPVVVPRGSVLGEVQVRRVILKGINEVSPSALSLFVLIGALSTPDYHTHGVRRTF